jgi:hypothetical protein
MTSIRILSATEAAQRTNDRQRPERRKRNEPFYRRLSALRPLAVAANR